MVPWMNHSPAFWIPTVCHPGCCYWVLFGSAGCPPQCIRIWTAIDISKSCLFSPGRHPAIQNNWISGYSNNLRFLNINRRLIGLFCPFQFNTFHFCNPGYLIRDCLFFSNSLMKFRYSWVITTTNALSWTPLQVQY